MAWTRYTHASVNSGSPRALGTCDRCGCVYNYHNLQWQFDWRGPKMQNLQILVCPTCYDRPQEQLRTILIPPDPVPIMNPRPDPHMWMGQSSSPPGYASGSPNTIATQSSNPIVTQDSSLPLITEINITPTVYPSPNSSGYV